MSVATWHYGLVARWWAEFNREAPELAFFRSFVEAGQPALDLACGSGRLLVPLLQAGLDVDGCDVSPDMLAFCRERALREGLPEPRLYAQALHELELPRRYRTIFVCGGFGIGTTRAQDDEALRRMHDHLEPGGLLVLDKEMPYAQWAWPYWRKEARAELPRPWRERGDRRTAADGTELELRSRLVDVDPIGQRLTFELRASSGELEEERTLTETFYFAHELVLMLDRAGFAGVELRAGHDDRPATADDEIAVFLARKPIG